MHLVKTLTRAGKTVKMKGAALRAGLDLAVTNGERQVILINKK